MCGLTSDDGTRGLMNGAAGYEPTTRDTADNEAVFLRHQPWLGAQMRTDMEARQQALLGYEISDLSCAESSTTGGHSKDLEHGSMEFVIDSVGFLGNKELLPEHAGVVHFCRGNPEEIDALHCDSLSSFLMASFPIFHIFPP